MKSVSRSSSSLDQPQVKVIDEERECVNEIQSEHPFRSSGKAYMQNRDATLRILEPGRLEIVVGYGVIGLGEPTIAGGLTGRLGCWLRWHVFLSNEQALVGAHETGRPRYSRLVGKELLRKRF